MNPKYFGLNQAIGQIVKAPGDQSRIVAIAVALAASAQAHLPSSAVENMAAYYGEQVHPFVVEKISDVGESVIFGAKSALEYAQLFWKMRYAAAFPAKTLVENAYQLDRLLLINANRPIDITTIWSGGIIQLSEEMNSFMNKYRSEIMRVASRVACALEVDHVGPSDLNPVAPVQGA